MSVYKVTEGKNISISSNPMKEWGGKEEERKGKRGEGRCVHSDKCYLFLLLNNWKIP